MTEFRIDVLGEVVLDLLLVHVSHQSHFLQIRTQVHLPFPFRIVSKYLDPVQEFFNILEPAYVLRCPVRLKVPDNSGLGGNGVSQIKGLHFRETLTEPLDHLGESLQLGQGSVLELDKLAGEPLEVLVNGKLVARGEVVVVNEKFGIRLTDIISPIERIETLK